MEKSFEFSTRNGSGDGAIKDMRFWPTGFKLDLRSLALGRILLGFICFVEFLLVFFRRNLYYSDQGLLPRSDLARACDLEVLTSLYLLGSWPSIQIGLLILSLLVSLTFLIGYRTRLSSILLWILVVSIQERNPLILIGGDAWLRLTLFWLMFLPLGEHFSMDRRGSETKDRVTTIDSIPALGLVLQVCIVYWWAGAAKHGADWRQGQALYYVFSDQEFRYGLSQQLLLYPNLLYWGTLFIPWLEVLAAFCLIFPIKDQLFRFLGVFSLVAMHLSIWMTLDIYHFSAIAIATLLLLAPSICWSKFGQEERAWSKPSPKWLALLLIFHIIGVGAYNLYRLSLREKPPPTLVRAADILGLHQQWHLFAPLVPKNSMVVYAVAELRDGTNQALSLLGEKCENPPGLDDPQYEIRLGRYWANIFECSPALSLRRLEIFAEWYERRWKKLYPDEATQLKSIKLYRQFYPIAEPGTTRPDQESVPEDPELAIIHNAS